MISVISLLRHILGGDNIDLQPEIVVERVALQLLDEELEGSGKGGHGLHAESCSDSSQGHETHCPARCAAEPQ